MVAVDFDPDGVQLFDVHGDGVSEILQHGRSTGASFFRVTFMISCSFSIRVIELDVDVPGGTGDVQMYARKR